MFETIKSRREKTDLLDSKRLLVLDISFFIYRKFENIYSIYYI